MVTATRPPAAMGLLTLRGTREPVTLTSWVDSPEELILGTSLFVFKRTCNKLRAQSVSSHSQAPAMTLSKVTLGFSAAF